MSTRTRMRLSVPCSNVVSVRDRPISSSRGRCACRGYQRHRGCRSSIHAGQPDMQKNYENGSNDTNHFSTSSPWLLKMVTDLVANIPNEIESGSQDGSDGAMIVRVTRNMNRKEELRRDDQTDSFKESSKCKHQSSSSSKSASDRSSNIGVGVGSQSHRRKSRDRDRTSCHSHARSSSSTFIYSLNDVDTRKIWEDEQVESIAYMKRLDPVVGFSVGMASQESAPSSDLDGPKICNNQYSGNKAIWGLSVSRRKPNLEKDVLNSSGESNVAEDGKNAKFACDGSGCFILTTTSSSCLLGGKSSQCHVCTRFTLTPTCSKIVGFTHANEVVESTWLH